MSQLPRYDSYKDSGVQWLGEIPSHWNVKQLKFAVTCNDEALGENTESDYEILYIDISSVSLTEGIKYKEVLLFDNAPSRARRIVKSGDVLVSTVRTYLKAITYVESAEDNLIASTGFAVLRPSEKFDSKFIGYWIQSEGMVGNIVANSVGVSYPAINSTDLVRLPIVELPLLEQKIIADFLDQRLAQVDALIAKQETLLEKLAEQRVALISHAVTKGLNPDVEMKESGVKWLGEVPSHWIDTKFKYYVYFQEGPGILAVDFRTEGVPLIRISGLKDNTVTLNGCNFLDEEKVKETWNHFKLTKKDMIISASASLSEACEVTDEAIGAIPYTGLIKVRSQQESLLKSYLKIFLSSRFFYEQVSILQTGATIQHYGPAHLRQISILVPPIEEQARIVEHVEKAVSEICALTSKVVKTLETLREYRSTLITQVVTGKIDVRKLKVN